MTTIKDFERRLTEIIEEIRKDPGKGCVPPAEGKSRPAPASIDDPLSSIITDIPAGGEAAIAGQKPFTETGREEEFLSRFGRYFLLEKLGFGNMAETFKTSRMDERDGRHHILKRLRIESRDEDFARYFLEDVKKISRLSHANIVAVTDSGKMNDYVYLVLEHVDGLDLGSLSTRLRSLNRRFPFALLAHIGIQVCDALAAAAEIRDEQDGGKPMIHGNIVPSNILVSFRGEVKLTDFSLFQTARILQRTMPGLLRKKIAYLSPQQARGEEIDSRADIYALGAVLYEMAGGDPVFPKESGLSLVNKVLNGQVIPVFSTDFEAPEIFKDAVLKSLQYEPGKRHASVGHFRQELNRSLLEEAGRPFGRTETARFMIEGLDATLPAVEDRPDIVISSAKPSPEVPSPAESPEPPVEPETEKEIPVPEPDGVEPEPVSPDQETELDILPSRHRMVVGVQNALVQRIAKMAFDREDFEIEVVGDGREVLEAALRTKADAVVLEIDLPHINGYDLCEVIKRSSDLRATKVILIRKEFEKVDERRLKLLNFDLLVQMPVKSGELAEKTRQILDRTNA